MDYSKIALVLSHSKGFIADNFVASGKTLKSSGAKNYVDPQSLSPETRQELVTIYDLTKSDIYADWDSLEAPTVEQVAELIHDAYMSIKCRYETAMDYYLQFKDEAVEKPNPLDWVWFQKWQDLDSSTHAKYLDVLGTERTGEIKKLYAHYANAKDKEKNRIYNLERKAITDRQEKEQESLRKAKQAELRERHQWAKDYGSEHLRLCLENGYDCLSLYLKERLAIEYPGFEVWEKGNLQDRACPSPEALVLSLSVPGSRVVWWTFVTGDGREVVLVKKWLNKYDIVFVIPDLIEPEVIEPEVIEPDDDYSYFHDNCQE